MIVLDFETRSTCDIRHGVTRYTKHPTTQVLCLCWVYDDEPEVHLWHRGHPWIEQSRRPDELLARIASGEECEAHNAGFEFGTWNDVFMREFPEIDVHLKFEQLHCSAAKGSCVSMPRALGDAAAAAGIINRKDERGVYLIEQLSKPMKKKKGVTGVQFNEDETLHRQNWEYCGQDVLTEREYSAWLPPMMPREREYWLMDQRMNQRGILLDQAAARDGRDLSLREADRLNFELDLITNGGVDRAARRAVFKDWINQELTALEADNLPDTRADTISFALYGAPTKAGDIVRETMRPLMEKKWEQYGERGEPLRRALEISLEVNRTSVGKYERMLECVEPTDGRLHDIMLYNGADRTGRWSGKGVQPHNFVRGYKEEMPEVWEDIKTLDLEFVTLIWGDPLPALAKACRGALIASPGKHIYAADFNAIEARKLAWLSNCASQLALFRSKGGDPYIDMAQAIYERPLNKKDHPIERNLGKKAVLGLGYAMGWEKFQMTVFMEEGIWLEDEFCQKIVKIYRKEKCPEVPLLWKAANDSAIAAVLRGGEHWFGGDEAGCGAISYFVRGPFLHCRLPSGRLLAYLRPEVHTRVTWRFSAINERGKPCQVPVSSRLGISTQRARREAERLAEKARKTLTNEPPESFQSPHLSFMGRDTFTRKWRRCGTHGGTLVENFDQASSRDLLAESMLRVDQDDRFDLLLSIHDEVIAEGLIGCATLQEFEDQMAEVPAWAPGMPIKAEGWIGERLRK